MRMRVCVLQSEGWQLTTQNSRVCTNVDELLRLPIHRSCGVIRRHSTQQEALLQGPQKQRCPVLERKVKVRRGCVASGVITTTSKKTRLIPHRSTQPRLMTRATHITLTHRHSSEVKGSRAARETNPSAALDISCSVAAYLAVS